MNTPQISILTLMLIAIPCLAADNLADSLAEIQKKKKSAIVTDCEVSAPDSAARSGLGLSGSSNAARAEVIYQKGKAPRASGLFRNEVQLKCHQAVGVPDLNRYFKGVTLRYLATSGHTLVDDLYVADSKNNTHRWGQDEDGKSYCLSNAMEINDFTKSQSEVVEKNANNRECFSCLRLTTSKKGDNKAANCSPDLDDSQLAGIDELIAIATGDGNPFGDAAFVGSIPFEFGAGAFQSEGKAFVYDVTDDIRVEVHKDLVAVFHSGLDLAEFIPSDSGDDFFEEFSLSGAVLVYNAGDDIASQSVSGNSFKALGITKLRQFDSGAVRLYAEVTGHPWLEKLGLPSKYTIQMQKTGDITTMELLINKWDEPLNIADSELRSSHIILTRWKEGTHRFRELTASGTLKLDDYSNGFYFYGTEKHKNKVPVARAMGLAADEITMGAVATLAMSLPALDDVSQEIDLKDALDELPLDDIKITNDDVVIPTTIGEKPDAFIVEYSVSTLRSEANKNFFNVNGALEVMAWELADAEIRLSKTRGIRVDASVETPGIDGLPFSGSGSFQLKHKKGGASNKMALTADFDLLVPGTDEVIAMGQTEISMGKDSISMAVDLGCMPPMLKATIQAESFSRVGDLVPQIGASDCAEQIYEELAALATGAYQAVRQAVADAYGAVAQAFGKDDDEYVSRVIPLPALYAQQLLYQNIVSAWDPQRTTISRLTVMNNDLDVDSDVYKLISDLPGMQVDKAYFQSQLDFDFPCIRDARLADLKRSLNGIDTSIAFQKGLVGDAFTDSDSYDLQMDIRKVLSDEIEFGDLAWPGRIDMVNAILGENEVLTFEDLMSLTSCAAI